MAKKLRLTQQDVTDLRNQFELQLSQGYKCGGEFKFTKTFPQNAQKAKLIFTPEAYIKMIALVEKFSTEIAWHGLARRDGENRYLIYDIQVYPQTVTGATVTTDQEKYQMWLFQHDDEEFNAIRFQGHSHVNMGTSPSGVDTNLYDRIVQQLGDQDFYIFVIWNKKNSKWINIYDMATNCLFETADVAVEVQGVGEFLVDAESKLAKPAVTTTYPAYAGGKTYPVNPKPGTYASGKQTTNAKQTQSPAQVNRGGACGFYDRYSGDNYDDDSWYGNYYNN